MVDPVEQAHIDDEHGAPVPADLVDLHEDWSAADWRAYWREKRRLGPAQGPLPWHLLAADVLFAAGLAEVLLATQRHWRLSDAKALPLIWALTSAGPLDLDGWTAARRESARRRGVVFAGDSPAGGVQPLWPSMAVALGAMAARARWRSPHDDAASVIVRRLANDLHERWQWRHHPVLGD